MEKIILANWKAFLGIRASVALAKASLLALQGRERIPRVVLFPSHAALLEVHKILAHSRLELGVQDVGFERYGAYTGGFANGLLEEVSASYALLGHAERRMMYAEDLPVLTKKLQALGESRGVTPVLCVGSSGGSREDIAEELRSWLASVSWNSGVAMPVLAYEPARAIGGSSAERPEDVLAVVRALRDVAKDFFQEKISVVYGGSVTPENAYTFLREPEIDGLLLGRSSVHSQEFEKILQCACEVLDRQA